MALVNEKDKWVKELQLKKIKEYYDTDHDSDLCCWCKKKLITTKALIDSEFTDLDSFASKWRMPQLDIGVIKASCWTCHNQNENFGKMKISICLDCIEGEETIMNLFKEKFLQYCEK